MNDLSTLSPLVKAEILSEALPSIQKYHGKTMVIKYGGNAMTDPALQKAFAEDIVLLKLVGINPVVVHGGGPQIETALKRLGKEGHFVQGMRVTDAETMGVVAWVLAGEVQQQIVGLINQVGGKAVGLTGRDGAMIRAHKLRLKDQHDPSIEHDVGMVGDIWGGFTGNPSGIIVFNPASMGFEKIAPITLEVLLACVFWGLVFTYSAVKGMKAIEAIATPISPKKVTDSQSSSTVTGNSMR